MTFFEKEFPQEISKSDQQFQRRFLKNCIKNSIFLPWQEEFLVESYSVNSFKDNPQGTFLPSSVQIGPVV